VKKINLREIMKRDKALYLAYDQGLEHGPEGDFDDENINPLNIINIANKAGFNALIVQKGIAEKYNKEIKNSKVPLIIKLNGKTRLYKGEPISAMICDVLEARALGACAVGFTIYLGSEFEEEMIEEFSKIEKEAHKFGLPVMLWAYPRGKSVKGKSKRELMAYAARAGLELGADIVKIAWNGNIEDLKWAVRSAGRCKVVIAGGVKENEKEFLKDAKEIMNSGAIGLAIGRNIWQSKNSVELAGKVKKIVFG